MMVTNVRPVVGAQIDVWVEAVVADDRNPCTNDSCDQELGCRFVNNSDLCDGNACTLGDTCQDGVCASGQLRSCDDSNPCTNDRCDNEQGCVYAFNQNPCNDSNACTINDQCNDGSCLRAPLKAVMRTSALKILVILT